MSISKLSPEVAVDYIAKGIEVTLLSEIRGKVQVFRDQIVAEIDAALEAACCDAAKNVVARVAEVRNVHTYEPELHIHFGKKE